MLGEGWIKLIATILYYYDFYAKKWENKKKPGSVRYILLAHNETRSTLFLIKIQNIREKTLTRCVCRKFLTVLRVSSADCSSLSHVPPLYLFPSPTISPFPFNRNKLQFQNNDYINHLTVMRVPGRRCDAAVGPVRLHMPLRERKRKRCTTQLENYLADYTDRLNLFDYLKFV